MSTNKNAPVHFKPDEWISQSDAAAIRGVSRQAINNLVKKGRLRTLELPIGVMVFKKDITDFKPLKPGRAKQDG